MQKLIRAALVLLVALSLLFGTALAEETNALQVHQINVGCADCYLFICGDMAFMIDCGIDQEKTAPVVDEYLAAAGFGKLDACFITHYHRDHVRNMNRVLSQFADENTIVYGPSAAMHRDFAPIAAGVYQQLVNYDELDLGDVHVTCVGPSKLNGAGAINKDSLNILVTYQGHRLLFTGDYVRSVDVLEQHGELVKDLDVLKFPHHGIIPFCIDAWALEDMNPDMILVSSGMGSNVKELLKKRKMTETQVYDIGQGNIVLMVTEEGIELHTQVVPGQFAQPAETDEAQAA